MITIFSFIPKKYIKYDDSGNPSISLFSSIKTSILNQTYTNWELLLVTNIENVSLNRENNTNTNNNNINQDSIQELKNNDHSEYSRIKIIYTSDSYLNLNTLFKINDNVVNTNTNTNTNTNNNKNNNINNSNINTSIYNNKTSNIINPQCKYISFFDLENDVWNINKLQIQYNLMASSDYDVIGCETTHSTQSISAVVPRTIKKSELSLFVSCPFLVSTVMIKREIFKHYNETLYKDECCAFSDYNFTIINSETNTLMAQFHALLLYLTLMERNIYCIHYSNPSNSSNSTSSTNLISNNIVNEKSPPSLYTGRTFNHSLVVTSLQSKITFLQEYKSCDHSFFINAKQYFEERFIRIRFFSDFCSSESCKQEYEEKCRTNRMDNYGPEKRVYITLNQTYTHAILLNCPIVPNISVPPERVLGLAFEPIPYLRLSYDFIHFADKYVGLYYIGYIHPNLTSPFFKEHHGFMWHVSHPQIPPTLEEKYYNSEAKQRNKISIIVSNKMKAPGNAYRHKLATFILINNLPIDIWGNGTTIHSKRFPNHKNIKGPFTDKEPYESYALSICIENYRHPHYFSEKITNCLVYNTTPIYLGCIEIDTYFPGQVIHLTGDIKHDSGLLVHISKNPSSYIREIKHHDNDNVLNLLKNLPWK